MAWPRYITGWLSSVLAYGLSTDVETMCSSNSTVSGSIYQASTKHCLLRRQLGKHQTALQRVFDEALRLCHWMGA